MSDRRSNRELVARVQGGDRRAFDLLVIKYQHKVASLISRYIRDPGETMDVAQDAFLKAYRALPGFRGESAFYTWLYRVVINTVKNHLIARGRRPPGNDLEADVAKQLEAGGVCGSWPRRSIICMSRGHRALAHLSCPRGDRQTLETLARALRKTMSEEQRRHLSALADGEIDPGLVHPTLAALESDKRLIAAWEGYHLIGAAMRSERICPEYRRIRDRMSERIAAEPSLRRRRVRRGRTFLPRLSGQCRAGPSAPSLPLSLPCPSSSISGPTPIRCWGTAWGRMRSARGCRTSGHCETTTGSIPWVRPRWRPGIRKVVGVTPRDHLRYGCRFYLDRESGLPLKSDLMGERTDPIEQVMFTSLDLLPSQGAASAAGPVPPQRRAGPEPPSPDQITVVGEMPPETVKAVLAGIRRVPGERR